MKIIKKIPALTIAEETALELLRVKGASSARGLVLLGKVRDSDFSIGKAAMEQTLLGLVNRRQTVAQARAIVTCGAGSEEGVNGPVTIYTITNYGRVVISAWSNYRSALESWEDLGK